MFELETGLMFWSWVSFLILLFILSKYILPHLLKIMDDRRALIEKSLKAAEEAKKQAEELKQKNKQEIKEIKERAEIILEKKRKEADEQKEEILHKAQERSREYILDAEEEARRIRKSALNKFKEQAAQIIIEATGRVMEENIEKDKHQKIIETVIGELEKKYVD